MGCALRSRPFDPLPDGFALPRCLHGPAALIFDPLALAPGRPWCRSFPPSLPPAQPVRRIGRLRPLPPLGLVVLPDDVDHPTVAVLANAHAAAGRKAARISILQLAGQRRAA